MSQNTPTCLRENRYQNLCHGKTIRQPTPYDSLNRVLRSHRNFKLAIFQL